MYAGPYGVVNEKTVMTETTNKEYTYETLPELEVILEQQYGQVHVQCMCNNIMVM